MCKLANVQMGELSVVCRLANFQMSIVMNSFYTKKHPHDFNPSDDELINQHGKKIRTDHDKAIL